MAEIRIEGQTFTLDDQIALDDARLRATLVAVTPIAATAEIIRTREGDRVVVSLLKRAGTKGVEFAELLAARIKRTPTWLAPAVSTLARLHASDPESALDLTDEDAEALACLTREWSRIGTLADRLARCPGEAARTAPEGF